MATITETPVYSVIVRNEEELRWAMAMICGRLEKMSTEGKRGRMVVGRKTFHPNSIGDLISIKYEINPYVKERKEVLIRLFTSGSD